MNFSVFGLILDVIGVIVLFFMVLTPGDQIVRADIVEENTRKKQVKKKKIIQYIAFTTILLGFISQLLGILMPYTDSVNRSASQLDQDTLVLLIDAEWWQAIAGIIGVIVGGVSVFFLIRNIKDSSSAVKHLGDIANSLTRQTDFLQVQSENMKEFIQTQSELVATMTNMGRRDEMQTTQQTLLQNAPYFDSPRTGATIISQRSSFGCIYRIENVGRSKAFEVYISTVEDFDYQGRIPAHTLSPESADVGDRLTISITTDNVDSLFVKFAINYTDVGGNRFIQQITISRGAYTISRPRLIAN